MALKEQSQRDLNYRKPSAANSRKPVANYVQPPSSQAKKSSNSQMHNKGGSGNRRVVDDDDDSEVEMLSISSGDEDIAKDQKVGSKGRGAAAGRGAKDDDRTWDGDEPARWKHVNEAEVCDNLGLFIRASSLFILLVSCAFMFVYLF